MAVSLFYAVGSQGGGDRLTQGNVVNYLETLTPSPAFSDTWAKIEARTLRGAQAASRPARPPRAARPQGLGGDPFTIGASFAGADMVDAVATGGLAPQGTLAFPPDSMGAIGPHHFLQVVNGVVAIFDRGGTPRGLASIDAFFFQRARGVTYPQGAPIFGFKSFDPRVIYDRHSGHWFVSACDINTGFHNSLMLAVSRTSNPLGRWDKYVVTPSVPRLSLDFPTMGVDDNGVYFAVDLINFPGYGDFKLGRLLATRKASLVSRHPSMGPTYLFQTNGLLEAALPATNHDVARPDTPAWFEFCNGDVFGGKPTDVALCPMRWGRGVPTFGSLTSIPTAPHAAPLKMPAPGSDPPLDVGGDYSSFPVIRGNQMWLSRSIGLNAAGGAEHPDRDAVEWMQIDVSGQTPHLVQSGRVMDDAPAAPRYYAFPSIMVNRRGDAVMGFCGAGEQELAGTYFCGRLSADPAGQMRPVTQVKAGDGVYNLGQNGYGDYSNTSLDPINELGFWMIAEFPEEPIGGIGVWGNWIANVTVGGSPASSSR